MMDMADERSQKSLHQAYIDKGDCMVMEDRFYIWILQMGSINLLMDSIIGIYKWILFMDFASNKTINCGWKYGFN